MKTPHFLTAALLMLTLSACNKSSGDSGRVIANVGGEKMTEGEFQALVKEFIPDGAKATQFLQDAGSREERNKVAEEFALQKAIIAFAKREGLDRDPKAKARMEQLLARSYFQMLIQKRTATLQPTEAQLQVFYKELVAQRMAEGQGAGLPPYGQVKDQLPALWRERQSQKAGEALLKEVREKIPITFADEYRSLVAK